MDINANRKGCWATLIKKKEAAFISKDDLRRFTDVSDKGKTSEKM